MAQVHLFGTLAEALPQPDQCGEQHRRVLTILVRLQAWRSIAIWVVASLLKERSDQDVHEAVRSLLASCGASREQVVDATSNMLCRRPNDGLPTSAGRFLLSQDDGWMTRAIRASGASVLDLARLCAEHAPGRLPALADAFLAGAPSYDFLQVCRLLLKRKDSTCEAAVARRLQEGDLNRRFRLSLELVRANEPHWKPRAAETARHYLSQPGLEWGQEAAAIWLIRDVGVAAEDTILSLLLRAIKESTWTHIRSRIFRALVGHWEARSVRILTKVLQDSEDLEALRGLLRFVQKDHRDLIRRALERGLRVTVPAELAKYVTMAAEWDIAGFAPTISGLLRHESKWVRETAARSLARQADAALAQVRELFADKEAEQRRLGTILAGHIGTPTAARVLEDHLAREAQEDLRDAVLRGLQRTGRRFTLPELRSRIDSTPANKGPVPWLKLDALPPLRASDGHALTPAEVAYLLQRQSRCKEMRADIEADPLYQSIDRSTSGDFALMVMRSFLDRGEVKDRWMLAVAGLLGDDRVVPLLSIAIERWGKVKGGVVAPAAVEALALLNSDAALSEIGALSIQAGTRNAEVSIAAEEAIAAASRARSVTVEDLIDRSVPWLGFESGKPRTIQAGARNVEVRIGLNWTLEYRQTGTPAWTSTPGRGVPAPVAADLKETGRLLKEVVESQKLRLEHSFAAGKSWSASRWKELFLGHPVLIPFAVRAIWSAWTTGSDAPSRTFRALQDLSLTTASDSPVALSGGERIGLAHPMTLPDEVIASWRIHFSEHELEEALNQIDRRVFRVPADQRSQRLVYPLSGLDTDHGCLMKWAAKSSWKRGQDWVWKRLGGVDVFIAEPQDVDPMQLDRIHQTALGFARADQIDFAAFDFDGPRDESDPRLLSLSEVPPVLYSEVRLDLEGLRKERPFEFHR